MKMKEVYKRAFVKFIDGVFLGIGFTIVLFIYISIAADMRNPDMNTTKSPIDDLSIISHERDTSGKILAFTGRIKNDGEYSWSKIKVEVELFRNKNFVMEYIGEREVNIEPNSEENFIIGFRPDDIPFDEYTIRIVNGY